MMQWGRSRKHLQHTHCVAAGGSLPAPLNQLATARSLPVVGQMVAALHPDYLARRHLALVVEAKRHPAPARLTRAIGNLAQEGLNHSSRSFLLASSLIPVCPLVIAVHPGTINKRQRAIHSGPARY
jgi:hypothetical protein